MAFTRCPTSAVYTSVGLRGLAAPLLLGTDHACRSARVACICASWQTGVSLDRAASLSLNNAFAPSFALSVRHRPEATADESDFACRGEDSAASDGFWVGGPRVEEAASTNGLTGLRVMVIDDSKTIRRTAEMLLKKEGCEVVTAVDGFEALAKISDQQSAHHLRRHHDAAPGWLSDLRADQEQPDFSPRR